MSRLISELETTLGQILVEHQKLLALLQTQQDAMKKCNLAAMDEMLTQQEACRLRIASLEQRRRAAVLQISREGKVVGDVTLRKLAGAYPQRGDALLKLRTDLKTVTEQIRTRAYVSGKVASAVLGHLNTVVRLVAGAVERAGVYNKRGVPRVSRRIGVMEAVG